MRILQNRYNRNLQLVVLNTMDTRILTYIHFNHISSPHYLHPLRVSKHISRAVHCSTTSSSPSASVRASFHTPAVFTSPLFIQNHIPHHDSHPERPERIASILKAIQSHPILSSTSHLQLINIDPSRMTDNRRQFLLRQLEKVHDLEYIQDLESMCNRGTYQLDADTYLNKESYETALLAAECWIQSVHYTMESGQPSFALSRPPGHHAVKGSGMGFCLLNYAAMCARYIVDEYNQRVSILDWDVHHGNGTESIVQSDSRIQFVSTHQMPWYPGTGRPDFKGEHGTICNIALAAGCRFETEYRSIYENQVLPVLKSKEVPDCVIVSAGYDALRVDPLASIELEPNDFGIMTELLFESLGHSKVVFGLEGGYNLEGLAQAVASTLESCVVHNEKQSK